MSDVDPSLRPLDDLIQASCDGLLDDASLRELERRLSADAEARRSFAEAHLVHSEIRFVVRSRHASEALRTQLRDVATDGPTIASPARRWSLRRFAPTETVGKLAAAVVLFALGWGFLAMGRPRPATAPATSEPSNVAWLVNAQDCQWAADESEMPGRDMRAGKLLKLRVGLAEIEFDQGARVLLQGPAIVELLTGNSARLVSGKMTAQVPPRAKGFMVLSPTGKVVDLGTEFGLTVDDRGNTTVKVFKGEVQASPLATPDKRSPALTLLKDQVALIAPRSVEIEDPTVQGEDASRFVRAIDPPRVIVPRSLELDFSAPRPGTLSDAAGMGIGLTHRLPGTGSSLPGLDPNLRLDPAARALRLTTTRSDINKQTNLARGEYLGFRLADLGFTGAEDFEISATIPEIPGLEQVGQFGLYAGRKSDSNIRGGLISQNERDQYRLFLVNNDGGIDADIHEIGVMNTGEDLKLTLRRRRGRYSLIVENQTRQSSSTLSIAHRPFLDGAADLYVGVFGANTQSDVSKTLTIRNVSVTVLSSRLASLPTSLDGFRLASSQDFP
ncbi:FecR domain-containing protein [Paludisphaera borealis]|uniref:FecR family protein n=1 Tax=Paludisphaera borealis TaxID=1387353 RepID=A0A1U7CLQ4_9BACT|nr:FecR domain-containing protein [Paludisphaera borealis]APW59847.1 FecR family protein [Paludisphaera borealis]